MDCLNNCPYIAKQSGVQQECRDQIVSLQELRSQIEAADKQNKATAKTVSKLPINKGSARARNELQQAIVAVGEALQQTDESIELQHTAIEATENLKDIVMSACIGEPSYVIDPNQSGAIVLACASPVLAELES